MVNKESKKYLDIVDDADQSLYSVGHGDSLTGSSMWSQIATHWCQ
jgi:hypothetical protein